MAKRLTKTERLIRYMTVVLGLKELSSSSRKYRKFTHLKDTDRFYFVGHGASCRVGKNISTSFSVTDRICANMEKWEATQLAKGVTND